jgi:hypothetical protein
MMTGSITRSEETARSLFGPIPSLNEGLIVKDTFLIRQESFVKLFLSSLKNREKEL